MQSHQDTLHHQIYVEQCLLRAIYDHSRHCIRPNLCSMMMFAQGDAPDRHGVPSHQPLHLLESGPRQALQTRSAPILFLKASWKMLFCKTFLQDVRERLETFLEWTPEWRRQGRKRQRMVQRKEERQRCGTRWWTDSKFLRPVLDPLGDPQQACGTWTCSKISSTGRASLRSIRLLWRTTARTEAVFCCCKDLPELDCLSPLLLADAQCPAPFWSLYLTLEDSRVVTGWQRLSGILCEGSNTNFFGRSEDSTESKSSLYVSIICYDYIIEIYLQLQSKATIFY